MEKMKTSTSLDLRKIRSLILDMDGVLWLGSSPIGPLSEIFKTLKAKGFKFIMATNNATRSPHQYVQKLASFGVNVESWQVVNSAVATASYLKKRFPTGGEVFTIGERPLLEILEETGFKQGTNTPLAVIAALDRDINYAKLTKATLLIRRGIPFIGTNPDRSYPIPEGQAPGAGSILAALEAASGEKPTIIGKPEPQLYRIALERLRTSHEETLVIGDRLETDILGAQNLGCPCALVLTGVSTGKQGEKWNPPIDIIADNLVTIINSLPAVPSE